MSSPSRGTGESHRPPVRSYRRPNDAGRTMSTISDAIRRFVGGDAGTATGPVQATWNGVVLAESDRTVVIEGNHYFPPEDVNTTASLRDLRAGPARRAWGDRCRAPASRRSRSPARSAITRTRRGRRGWSRPRLPLAPATGETATVARGPPRRPLAAIATLPPTLDPTTAIRSPSMSSRPRRCGEREGPRQELTHHSRRAGHAR